MDVLCVSEKCELVVDDDDQTEKNMCGCSRCGNGGGTFARGGRPYIQKSSNSEQIF